MRLATPCRQCIASAASNTTMSSSGFNSRGRSVWGRGLCDSPGSGGRGRGGSYVSGDSHTRSVRDANYGYRHGYGGNFGFPGGGPQQPFRTWQPVASRPPPRPKPADYRNWVFSLSQPPPQCERFTVLSYNILADYLARDHQPKLYFHIPSHILDWEWRKRKLLFEFGLWSSDIMCLQEVDRFHDLEEELTIQGYSGIWKMRTGTAVDGCAIFWRTNRFDLCHEEQIEFNKLGLRDNVAQICVLESRSKNPAENSSSDFPTSPDHPSGANRVVICNIHVLYNPKRGEIKLGQVRTLLDRAYAVSRIWSDAPVVICGDFNCTPKSPLYNYLSEKKLNLSGLARDQVSGQHSARLYAPQPYFGSGLYRAQPHRDDTVLDAAAVKQGSYCTGIQNQYKPQNDVENASLSNNITFPQKIMSMLDVSGNSSSYNLNRHEENAISDDVTKEICQESFDGHCTGSNSGPRSVVDSLKESCDRISETTTNIGNDRGQQVTAPTLCEDHLIKVIVSEHCEIVHDVDYSKSSSGKSDEQMHRSSFKGQELSYGLVDSSLEEVKNSSNFCTGNPSVSTELLYDVSGLYSSENTSENVSLNAAVSFSSSTVGSSSDSITKEKSAFAGQNPFVCKNLGSSICSDSALDLDSINSSLDGLGKTTLEDGRFTEIQTEEASQSLGEPLPASGLLVGQFEGAHSKSNELISDSYCGHFGQNDKLSSNFPHSEDMSDPNFLEELHGKDRVYEFGVDLASLTLSSSQPSPSSFPGSHETNNFSSLQGHHVLMEEVNFERLNVTLSHQPQLDSSGFVQERNMYDPSLWTPMEIETASGNAECTDLEHNLKLKSAYAEVEDYAGTKDSNREPQVTSYNRQFMGTVDYIWFSEGLETVKVLDTIPKHVLQRTPGFPTQKWGSDHLAIACQLAFRRGAIK